ncbi:hypothetical protein G6F58_013839 [Rhizopus delemar]|nr:hypothetical protein G6F58_013839 [Rhizopus delemar]
MQGLVQHAARRSVDPGGRRYLRRADLGLDQAPGAPAQPDRQQQGAPAGACPMAGRGGWIGRRHGVTGQRRPSCGCARCRRP